MEAKNEIVVYQPDEVLRLEVKVADESVWLTQAKMGELFGVDRTVINRHIHNSYKSGELCKESTCAKNAQVQNEGGRQITRVLPIYNLDVIIAVGYRVNSLRATRFRQWATCVLKSYLINGFAVNARVTQLEGKVDRNFSKHEQDISRLQSQVDFFVQTQTPPLQGVFYDGQLWDARSLVEQLIARARTSILLIDNWVGVGTLDMLAKKGTGVTVTIVTSEHRDRKGNPLLASLEVKKCWHTDDFTIEKMRGMCYHSIVWTTCNDECEKIQHDC